MFVVVNVRLEQKQNNQVSWVGLFVSFLFFLSAHSSALSVTGTVSAFRDPVFQASKYRQGSIVLGWTSSAPGLGLLSSLSPAGLTS